MTWEQIASMIMSKTKKTETVQTLWNACAAAMSRIGAEEGLKDGLQTIEVYEQTRQHYTGKWGDHGWRTAREVLGDEEYEKRAKKKPAPPTEAPAVTQMISDEAKTLSKPKKLQLKCGCPCRMEGNTAVTTGSCGREDHPAGRQIKLRAA